MVQTLKRGFVFAGLTLAISSNFAMADVLKATCTSPAGVGRPPIEVTLDTSSRAIDLILKDPRTQKFERLEGTTTRFTSSDESPGDAKYFMPLLSSAYFLDLRLEVTAVVSANQIVRLVTSGQFYPCSAL